MRSIYNQYHCCAPDVRKDLGLSQFDADVRLILLDAKNAGLDYHQVAMEMIGSITASVGSLNITHAMAVRQRERNAQNGS